MIKSRGLELLLGLWLTVTFRSCLMHSIISQNIALRKSQLAMPKISIPNRQRIYKWWILRCHVRLPGVSWQILVMQELTGSPWVTTRPASAALGTQWLSACPRWGSESLREPQQRWVKVGISRSKLINWKDHILWKPQETRGTPAVCHKDCQDLVNHCCSGIANNNDESTESTTSTKVTPVCKSIHHDIG